MPPRRERGRSRAVPLPAAPGPAVVVGIPALDDTRTPLFSFEYADKDYNGAWSWATEAEAHALLSFMSEVGKLTWAEIRPRKGKPPHHIQTIDTICREAQDRITELGIDHLVELLFRFGVGNKGRLWGFVINGVFYVLWWDRDHQVCPVDPP